MITNRNQACIEKMSDCEVQEGVTEVSLAINHYGWKYYVFFRFLSNEPKAPALWATLAFWILNLSLAVAARADYHAVFLRLKNLLAYFSP
jgi:hypothetical protein